MTIAMVQLGSMTRNVLVFEVQSDLQMSHLLKIGTVTLQVSPMRMMSLLAVVA